MQGVSLQNKSSNPSRLSIFSANNDLSTFSVIALLLSIFNIINLIASNANNNNNRNNINDNANNNNDNSNTESNGNPDQASANQVMMVPPGAGRRRRDKRYAEVNNILNLGMID